MSSQASVLGQIEAALLDESVPIAAVLRKCVVLAGRTGSADLHTWATQELNGYERGAKLPDYRLISGTLSVDGIAGNYRIQGEAISTFDLPEAVREAFTGPIDLTQGIGEVESMASQARAEEGYVRLTVNGSIEAARLTTYHLAQNGQRYTNVSAIYWKVSESTLRGVIDQVRNKLAQLVAELRSSSDHDEPSSEDVQQAVSVAIYGGRTKIGNITSAQAAKGSIATVGAPSETEPLWKRVPKAAWTILTGVAILLTAWFSYVLMVK